MPRRTRSSTEIGSRPENETLCTSDERGEDLRSDSNPSGRSACHNRCVESTRSLLEPPPSETSSLPKICSVRGSPCKDDTPRRSCRRRRLPTRSRAGVSRLSPELETASSVHGCNARLRLGCTVRERVAPEAIAHVAWVGVRTSPLPVVVRDLHRALEPTRWLRTCDIIVVSPSVLRAPARSPT